VDVRRFGPIVAQLLTYPQTDSDVDRIMCIMFYYARRVLRKLMRWQVI